MISTYIHESDRMHTAVNTQNKERTYVRFIGQDIYLPTPEQILTLKKTCKCLKTLANGLGVGYILLYLPLFRNKE